MNQPEILWTQQANKGKTDKESFFIFIYEFVSARYSFIALIGLVNIFTFQLKIYSYILSFGISLIIYLLFRETFYSFWTGLNLKYSISKESIIYEWGIFRDHELVVSFNDIFQISALYNEDYQRSAIVFSNYQNITNSKYGFSNELYSKILSFENVDDIQEVINLLNNLRSDQSVTRKILKEQSIEQKISENKWYLKLNQLLAFGYLYMTIYLSIVVIDVYILSQQPFDDVVISQEIGYSANQDRFATLTTSGGYIVPLLSDNNYKNEQISFSVSSLTKTVTSFRSYKRPRDERLINGPSGISLLFKLLSIVSLFLSSLFVFYHRGVIAIEDFPVLLILPLSLLAASYYLFY